MAENKKGNLLLSYLYPENMKDFEKVDFDIELKHIVAKAVSEKYPELKYLLVEEEVLDTLKQ